ncbi:hypothetical protein ACIPMZ_17990 [Scandinavium goeteborgense]|uniref:hypothetical protein n=1 Tax=Scandinavium goeteborgense TaxID=1851514 RepID=UPI0037F2FF2C
MSEIGFKFKGRWWDEETFSAVLRRILDLHRAVSFRRVAYHFGADEKAVRKLVLRSALAARLINEARAQALQAGGKAATYREKNYYHLLTGDVAKLDHDTEADRQRLEESRREQEDTSRAELRKAAAEHKARRHEAVQSCKRDGLTQTATAKHLDISLSTVKRFWPDVLTVIARKRGRPALKVEEMLIREIMKEFPESKTPALHTAQLLEMEGQCVPAALLALARAEISYINPC